MSELAISAREPTGSLDSEAGRLVLDLLDGRAFGAVSADAA